MLIFLIGFMGSGKTHWGELWADAHHLPFIDLDEVIEKAEGKSVTTIFENKGEDYFREIEAKALRTFADKQNTIIACGGGTPCFYDNMKWMNERGTTVYLFASAPAILERVMEETDKRPLLKNLNPGEVLFFIEQKLKERELFYGQAKIILPVEDINAETFPEKILNLF